MMEVTVGDDTQRLIEEKMKSGRYASPDALVNDAVRQLHAQLLELESARSSARDDAAKMHRHEETDSDESKA